jgi:hypothetical protein
MNTLDMFISILAAEGKKPRSQGSGYKRCLRGLRDTSANTVFPKRGTIHEGVLE